MSWADANLNEDPVEVLSRRITDLEDTITSQFDQLRAEIGMAVASMRSDSGSSPSSFLGDLEEQLAHAVTVSLSAALEAIRQSLTDVVSEALGDLDKRMSGGGGDIDAVAAHLQHAVLLALSTFEQSVIPATALGPPATAADIERVHTRIDELRTLLLG